MAPKSGDPRIDLIMEQLKALDQLGPMSKNITDLVSSMGTIKEELGSLTFTVNNHEDRLTALEKEMVQQKEFANSQQQQLRSLTVRFLNIPYMAGESANNNAKLKDTIYNRFLHPLLAAAANKNELPNIPPIGNIIESCFRPFAPLPDKPPPPVIIKLANRQVKIALMKNRRELPKPTREENTGGITRFILIEDLSPDNHRALAALSKSKHTQKVWSVDGRIKFTKVDNPDVVLTVKSVYDSVAKILSD